MSLRGTRPLASVIARDKDPKQSQFGAGSAIFLMEMEKEYYIYIMTNKNNTVLYTGVTNDLKRRVYEHKEKLTEGFTKKYNTTKLVYYEIYKEIDTAIMRNK
jgi:putative endonuclease